MKYLCRSLFFTASLLLSFFITSTPALAADIFADETILLTEKQKNLKDMYLFGETITVNAPITNDLVAAGATITTTKAVTGSMLAAGGEVIVKGTVGNTVRIVGGDIVIDGTVANDVIVMGGTTTITKRALIGGDLVFLGGKLIVEGPVKGKLIARGGDVTLNSSVGEDVETAFGEITLGPDTIIHGNLLYASSEKAIKDNGATVEGTTRFHYLAKEQPITNEIISLGGIYKLATDILISVLLILFFGKFILIVLTRITKTPFKDGGIGLAYLIFAPLIIVLSFFLLWLGAAALLVYLGVLLLTLFTMKIFIGWGALSFIASQQKKHYVLDWKAGVVGPIVVFLLLLIPVIGWIAIVVAFLFTFGALTQELISGAKTQRLSHKGGFSKPK